MNLNDFHSIDSDDSNGMILTTMAFVHQIQNVPQPKALSVLCHSGSNFTYIKQQAIPPGAMPSERKDSHSTDTAVGPMSTNKTVLLSNITLL